MWAIEHFENYVYGIKFQVISDHKALSSVHRKRHIELYCHFGGYGEMEGDVERENFETRKRFSFES